MVEPTAGDSSQLSGNVQDYSSIVNTLLTEHKQFNAVSDFSDCLENLSKMDSSGAGYPEAWVKAQEALKKAHLTGAKVPMCDATPASASVSAASSSTPQMSQNAYNYCYPAQPPMYGFPLFPPQNYANYSNVSMPNPYVPYYGYPPQIAAYNQQYQLQQNSTSQKQLSDSSANSVPLSELASKPPPPPPMSPSASNEKPEYPHANTMKNKQAPGAGGIRFSMPKRRAQKRNCLVGFNKKQNQSFTANHNSSPPHEVKVEETKSESKPFAQLGFKQHDMVNWPPELKDYLANCFESCTSQIHKDCMAIKLKGKLGQALHNGSLWSKDWSKEEIISLCKDPPASSNNYSQSPKSSAVGQKNVSERQKASSASYRRSFENQPSSSSHHSHMAQKSSGTDLKHGHERHRESPPYRRKRKSHSRSKSRSSSSRSPSPYLRRVVQRRDHSSSRNSVSSGASSGNGSTQIRSVCSSVVTPSDNHSKSQNPQSSKKKKKKKKSNFVPFVVNPEDQVEQDLRLQQRAARFKIDEGQSDPTLTLTINNFSASGNSDESDIDWSSYAIVGTCQNIEKPFLRLTSAVDPSTIRPQEVLEKSLAMVKDSWLTKNDYHFACEQLKSIRQDLVVQCIRNIFTVTVYETHARIALEKGDHTEFNQCQSQLRVLHVELDWGNREEFIAYRILYYMHTKDTREINNILSSISPEMRRNPVILHAFSLYSAWILNNFHKFFKLYVTAPKMGGFIVDWFVDSVRKTALKAYFKTFRPTLPVSFLENELGFTTADDLKSYLEKLNLVYSEGKATIFCKESMSVL